MTGREKRAKEKSWGTRVAERREALGLSQEQLAQLIGKTQQTVSRVELDNIVPRIETMESIVRALGANFEDLFPWSSRPAIKKASVPA